MGESAFIRAVADVVRETPFRETYLVAPSDRVGRMWTDRLARMTGCAFNLRITTLRRLAIDAANISALGLELVSPLRGQAMIRDALVGMKKRAGGYFSALKPSLATVSLLHRAISELRLADISAESIWQVLSPPAKAGEMAALHTAYGEALKKGNFVDIADCLRMGVAGGGTLPGRYLIPLDAVMDFSGWERRFWLSLPEDERIELPVDEGDNPEGVELFRSDGETAEVAEVFRRLFSKGIALDQVEIVYTDPAYAGIVYDLVVNLAKPGEEIPVTFQDGVPALYSRPARLLKAWTQWIAGGMPPEGLARMLLSGFLKKTPGSVSFDRMASLLRELPVRESFGYLPEIRRAERNSSPHRADAAAGLKNICQALVQPSRGGRLDTAQALLADMAEAHGELDAFVRRHLCESIAEAREVGLDGEELSWLSSLPDGLRVMGRGPLPGRLHVSPLSAGGHSGRPYVFVVGLDDARFPGGGDSDPALSDRERERLGLRVGKRSRVEAGLRRLIARQPGRTTLSCSISSLGEERFASTFFLSRARLAMGCPEAGQKEMDDFFGIPAAPVPKKGDQPISVIEDWLSALRPERAGVLSVRDLAPWFPSLSDGDIARRERESTRFTRFDGNVPEAGFDPADAKASVMSARRLETFGKCPLDFFFRDVLGIEPPKRFEHEPGSWLDPLERGALLHEVFRKCLAAVQSRALNESAIREEILTVVEGLLKETERSNPAPDPLTRQRTFDDLARVVEIFMQSEAENSSQVACLEASFGMESGEDPTPWDKPDPVEISLPSGRVIKTRGRVDRIDQVGGGLILWDYKTGRADGYSLTEPFNGGRHLQPVLYTALVNRVREAHAERVTGFGYYFISAREEGRRVVYKAERLKPGLDVIDKLVSLMAEGRYPFATSYDDVKYSDYLPIYRDPEKMVDEAKRKTENDPALAAWAELRLSASTKTDPE